MAMIEKIVRTAKGAVAAAMIAVACLAAGPAAAFAYEPVSVDLPVTVVTDGAVPAEPETFNVVLAAAEEGAPMPEGSEDGTFTIQVTGGTISAFPSISYATPGVWSYTAWQEPGVEELGIYDESVYEIVISWTNSESGELITTVALHQDNLEAKPTSIEFSNYYDEPLPDTGGLLPQTGDELMKIIISLTVICIAAAVCIAILRRSKIQRAEHRR